MSIKVYTDGACKGNPGPGGWGVYIQSNEDEKELYGGNPETTNNQMEMQAALEALKYLKDEDVVIELYTDSNYLRQGITEWIHKWKKNNWKTAAKKPVANRDLWIEISDLNEKMKKAKQEEKQEKETEKRRKKQGGGVRECCR